MKFDIPTCKGCLEGRIGIQIKGDAMFEHTLLCPPLKSRKIATNLILQVEVALPRGVK